MAIDFTHPATSDNYSTAYTPAIINNTVGVAQWLDPTYVTITGTPNNGIKRYNSATGRLQQWVTSSWVDLVTGYLQLTGGSLTGGVVMANTTDISWKDSGGTARRIALLSGGNSLYYGDVDNAISGGLTLLLANSQVLFYTGGTQKAGIDSSGNLFIGGTTPRAKLDVINNTTGSTVDADIHLGYSASGFYGYKITNSNNPSSLAAGAFKIQRGTTGAWVDDFNISNDGNLGFGTVGATSGGPKLTVYGNYTIMQDGTYTGMIGKGSTLVTGGAVSDFAVRVDTGSLLFATNASLERMRIDSAGKVGIGVSPITTLTVIANGTCQAVANITDAGSRLGLLHIASNDNQQGGGGGGIVFGAGVTSFAAIRGFTTGGGGNTTGDLVFTTRRVQTDTSLTEAVRIYANGDTLFSSNVGIGIAPSYGLDVRSTILRLSTSSFTSNSYIGQGAVSGAAAGDFGITAVTGSLLFATGGSLVERMRIDAAGNIGIAAVPVVRLHTKSANEIARFETTVARGSGQLFMSFYDPTGRKGYLGYGSGSNDDITLSNDLNGHMNFITSSSVQMKITNTGIIQDGSANELGYKGLPTASVTTGAFVAADRGKIVMATAGVTVPNSTMAAGDVVTIFNTTASAITITATVTTLRLAGSATTGNRTLAGYGIATIFFQSSTVAISSGTGLS
jgi:hypothetical protein